MIQAPLAALSPNSDFVTACYIVAFSLFIFGIRQGTHPSTARRGNLIAAAGMLIAMAGVVSRGLEGAHRPGHFDGVATVVTNVLDNHDPVFGTFNANEGTGQLERFLTPLTARTFTFTPSASYSAGSCALNAHASTTWVPCVLTTRMR